MLYRIRNFFIILLLLLVGFILQYTVIARIPVLGCGPNIMLIITFVFAYTRGKNAGMLVGFAAGLMMDVFYCQVIGYNALVLLLIGLVCGFCSKYFYSNNLYTPVFIIILCELAYNFAYYFVWYVLHARFSFSYCFVHMMLPELCLTLIAAILLVKPIMFLISKMYMYYDVEEQE